MSGERVVVGRAGGVDLVRFEGEVDLANAPSVHARVLDGTGEDGPVVLDLAAVSFLDSAGIRVLDDLVHHYESSGRALRVVAPDDSVARFTLTMCAFRAELMTTNVVDALAALPRDEPPPAP